MTSIPEPILSPRDPPPVTVVAADSNSPLLLVCDHAGISIPDRFGNMDLEEHHLSTHYAVDIGAKELTLALSERLKAAAILANYSRLFLNPNRSPDCPHLSPCYAITGDTAQPQLEVPPNIRMTAGEREGRLKEIYWPFHNAIDRQLHTIESRNQKPILIFVHTLTQHFLGKERIWDIMLLTNTDHRLAHPALGYLMQHYPELKIGYNVPYTGEYGVAYSSDHHGFDKGNLYLLFEVRNDLLSTEADVNHWADILTNMLQSITQNV